MDQPFDFEHRIEDGERQFEQRRDVRPSYKPHVEDVDVRATSPSLYKPCLRAAKGLKTPYAANFRFNMTSWGVYS